MAYRRVVADAGAAIAAAGVTSGASLFVHSAAAAPTHLLAALVDDARARKLTRVGVTSLHLEGAAPHLAPDVCPSIFSVRQLFVSSNSRKAINEGRAGYIPCHLSEGPALFTSGSIPVDVALISVSPPDRHGFCSLGPSADVSVGAISVARRIIAQVNPSLPRTFGDTVLHTRRIDVAYEQDTPVHAVGVAGAEEGPEMDAIGKLIADNLVPPRATLQLGIGAVPDAVCRALTGAQDLGLHTELLSDGALNLVELGVVTGAYKVLSPGRVTASFAAGSSALYAWMHDCSVVEMRSFDYVNAAHVIAAEPRLVSINSCVEMDITGQVCSESIGSRLYSGTGGQVDFMRSAQVSILALQSMTKHGESRIVGCLKPGAAVTSARANVRYVVTEHGIASLRGKTLGERAQALIAIAAPQHRDALQAAARDLMLR
jgi:4-hydroxybutyrate CoA-transferase